MVAGDALKEVIDYGMVIDGETTDAMSGERFDVEYPYTRDVWATVPHGGSEDVDTAVSAARDCFENDEWQSMTATGRGKLLLVIALDSDRAYRPGDQVFEIRDTEKRLDHLRVTVGAEHDVKTLVLEQFHAAALNGSSRYKPRSYH